MPTDSAGIHNLFSNGRLYSVRGQQEPRGASRKMTMVVPQRIMEIVERRRAEMPIKPGFSQTLWHLVEKGDECWSREQNTEPGET